MVWRATSAVALQDTYLGYGTVADNLRFGKFRCDQEELGQQRGPATAHDFIQALSQGYETIVGERGLRLSAASVTASPLPAPC